MTDISKYKSLAVSHDCYEKIGKIAKSIAPGVTLSRAQTIKMLNIILSWFLMRQDDQFILDILLNIS